MPGLSVQEVEQRLGAVKCAICKGSSFGIDQRFMQADGEWRGVCKKCFYSFPLYTDMEFYLRTQPDVPYRLKEISCTACNHRGVSLDFRATMSVRRMARLSHSATWHRVRSPSAWPWRSLICLK